MGWGPSYTVMPNVQYHGKNDIKRQIDGYTFKKMFNYNSMIGGYFKKTLGSSYDGVWTIVENGKVLQLYFHNLDKTPIVIRQEGEYSFVKSIYFDGKPFCPNKDFLKNLWLIKRNNGWYAYDRMSQEVKDVTTGRGIGSREESADAMSNLRFYSKRTLKYLH